MRRIVIMSSDDSHYMDYMTMVKHAWIRLGFEPVFAHVSNGTMEDQNVIDLPVIEGVPESFQAQIARWYVCKFFPSALCMTSDIDMMPMSNKYFDAAFARAVGEQDSILVMSSDAYGEQHHAFPMCYNIGMGSVITKLMDLDVSWEEYVRRAHAFGWGWNYDERSFYEAIKGKGQKVSLMNRGWNSRQQANNRLDRADWKYNLADIDAGKYFDCHCIRPFKEHEAELKLIFEHISKK